MLFPSGYANRLRNWRALDRPSRERAFYPKSSSRARNRPNEHRKSPTDAQTDGLLATAQRTSSDSTAQCEPTEQTSRTGPPSASRSLHWQGQLARNAIIAKPEGSSQGRMVICHQRRCFCGGRTSLGLPRYQRDKRSTPTQRFRRLCPVTDPPIAPQAMRLGFA